MRYTYEITMHSDDGRSKVVSTGSMDQEAYDVFMELADVVLLPPDAQPAGTD